MEIIGSIVIILFVGLSQASGRGGGFLCTPILISNFGYSTKLAIAMVFLIMFCGSLSNVVIQLKKKTKKGTPIIDYDLVLISLPSARIGTILGIIMKNVMSEFFICILLLLALINNIQKTNGAYKKLANQEKKQIQDFQQSDFNYKNKEGDNVEQVLIKYANHQFPINLIVKMIFVQCISLLISLIKGGRGLDSLVGIEYCSLEYWLLNVELIILMLMMILIIQQGYSDRNEELKSKKLLYQTNCTENKTIKFALAAFLAAMIGSSIGLGGGIILFPIWLELGIDQTQASASSLVLLLFNSFENFIQTYIAGAYSNEQILYFGFLALISSIILSNSLQIYAQTRNRNSLLLQIMVYLMLGATAHLSYILFQNIMQNNKNFYSFGTIC